MQDFLREINVRAIHDGQAASNSISSPIRKGRSSQVLDADVASNAGELAEEVLPTHTSRD